MTERTRKHLSKDRNGEDNQELFSDALAPSPILLGELGTQVERKPFTSSESKRERQRQRERKS